MHLMQQRDVWPVSPWPIAPWLLTRQYWSAIWELHFKTCELCTVLAHCTVTLSLSYLCVHTTSFRQEREASTGRWSSISLLKTGRPLGAWSVSLPAFTSVDASTILRSAICTPTSLMRRDGGQLYLYPPDNCIKDCQVIWRSLCRIFKYIYICLMG